MDGKTKAVKYDDGRVIIYRLDAGGWRADTTHSDRKSAVDHMINNMRLMFMPLYEGNSEVFIGHLCLPEDHPLLYHRARTCKPLTDEQVRWVRQAWGNMPPANVARFLRITEKQVAGIQMRRFFNDVED